MSDLRFTYHGSLTSNNRVTRRTKQGKILKSASAREDQKKVKALAIEAVAFAMPLPPMGNACEVEIVAWNTRKDCGNIEKVICDGMTGVAYDDDRRITKLTVEKRKDRGGERYEVTVRPAQPWGEMSKEPPRRVDTVCAHCGLAIGHRLNCRYAFPEPPVVHTAISGAINPIRRVEDLKSGDVLNFAERDTLLESLGVTTPVIVGALVLIGEIFDAQAAADEDD